MAQESPLHGTKSLGVPERNAGNADREGQFMASVFPTEIGASWLTVGQLPSDEADQFIVDEEV
jgi:hypothetical protein